MIEVSEFVSYVLENDSVANADELKAISATIENLKIIVAKLERIARDETLFHCKNA